MPFPTCPCLVVSNITFFVVRMVEVGFIGHILGTSVNPKSVLATCIGFCPRP